jgi:hypothetical protein
MLSAMLILNNGIGTIAAQVRDTFETVIVATNVAYQVSNVELVNVYKNILQYLLFTIDEFAELMNCRPRILSRK